MQRRPFVGSTVPALVGAALASAPGRALPLLALAPSLAAAPAAARAQAPLPRPAPPPPRFTVAANPIAPLFGAYGAEVEVPLGHRGFTVGVGGTYDTDRENVSWAEGKLLYYFGRTPLSGLALGATAGLAATRGYAGGCGGATQAPDFSHSFSGADLRHPAAGLAYSVGTRGGRPSSAASRPPARPSPLLAYAARLLTPSAPAGP